MARTKNIVSGTKKTLDALNKITNNVRSELNLALLDISNSAASVAKDKLYTTDHTQKYGDSLAMEIGNSVKGGKATIYAPITNTLEMRNQMYYAEYGAGVVGGEDWVYKSLPQDKNPRKFRKKGTGDLLARANYSAPVGYMRAARRYIIENANNIVKSRISFVIGRRYAVKYWEENE